MREIIAACAAILCLNIGSAEAQTNKETEITQKICEAAKNMQTMTCDFVQTRRTKMLKNPVVSEGSMTYRQPDCIVWECKTPNAITFVTNGKRAKVTADGKTTETELADNKIFKRIMRISKGGFGIENIIGSTDFAQSVSEDATEWTVTLTPLRKELKQMISSITLKADKKDAVVKTIIVTDKNGDTTTSQFKNIVINGKIDGGLFSF